MSDVIVGLDIGTCNVRVVVAEFADDGKLEVIGIGKSVSTGLRKGVVQNIEATIQAITAAVDEAETMSGREVKSCFVAIGGSQISGFNSKGLVAVSTKNNKGNREVDQTDINRVIENARAINIPPDRQILHIIPQSYTLDDQSGIKQPRAMIGVRLEVEAHIVTVSVTSMENIKRCVTRANYQIDGIVLKTLAAARSVMTAEERELGSILIDLGGGTTDVLVLKDDAPFCSCSVPVGGKMVTKDIAIVKGISEETAEKIKLSAGCCWESLLDSQDTVMIPGVGGRPPEEITRQELCQIIQPRMEEIFMMARDELALQTKSKQLSGNVVLCGAGADMPGVLELASEIFGTTAVRIGKSANLGGLYDNYHSPGFGTATGIVLMYADQYRQSVDDGKMQSRESHKKNGEIGKKILGMLKEWF